VYVDDPQALRECIESRLSFSPKLAEDVAAEVTKLLDDHRLMRLACTPLSCRGVRTTAPCTMPAAAPLDATSPQVRAPIRPHLHVQSTPTSETLLQVLLTTRSLEEPLTSYLLETLVSICDSETGSGDEGDADALLPQLILQQLKVLDNGNCSDAVAGLLIEAFASLPPDIQAQMAAIVGDTVPEERTEGVALRTCRTLDVLLRGAH
jgi:hypothetical protein